MKLHHKAVLGRQGITIVEVLVALGIIAIITGISVPNYTKMKRSSKKAEAQAALGQIYMAEKAFYIQYRHYTVDLVAVGAIPEGRLTYNVGFSPNNNDGIQCQGQGDSCSCNDSNYRGPCIEHNRKDFYYLCGTQFGEDSPGSGDGDGSGTTKSCAYTYKTGGADESFTPPDIPAGYDATNPATTASTPGTDPPPSTNNEPTFKVGAIADLVGPPGERDDNEKLDEWSINQYKQITRECGKLGKKGCPY